MGTAETPDGLRLPGEGLREWGSEEDQGAGPSDEDAAGSGGRLGEEDVEFWHDLDAGFAGREPFKSAATVRYLLSV